MGALGDNGVGGNLLKRSLDVCRVSNAIDLSASVTSLVKTS